MRLLSIACALVGVAVLPTAAGAQKPVAVVVERLDVDGDGKTDELRLDAAGSLALHLGGKPSADAWKPLALDGKVIGGRLEVGRGAGLGGHTVVLVVAETGTRRGGARARTAIALSYRPGGLDELWRGPLPGPDGATEIAITPYGLVAFAPRMGAYRCDDAPTYPNARRFDIAARRFRPAAQPIAIDPGAPTLRATPARPASIPEGSAPVLFTPRGASSALVFGTPRESVPPLEIADQNPRTAWVEDKGGYGRGEFVTLATAVPGAAVRALAITPGVAGERRFNRPTRLGLLVGDRAMWLELPADPATRSHWVVLPEAIPARCVTAIVADVAPPSASRRNQGATAIAELAVYTDAELEPGGPAAFLAARVAAGGAGAGEAERTLTRLGPGVADAVLAEIEKADDAAARRRLRHVLAALPAAPAELVRGLVADGDEVFVDGLVKLGDGAVPALEAALASDGGARAARVLGRIDSDAARAALRGAAGQGSRTLRREVALALGQIGDVDVLIAAARAEAEAGRRADLWRAVAAAARGTSRDAAAAAIAEALASERDYEVSYRLLEGGATLGGPALDAVAVRIAALRKEGGAEAVALRRVAVAALPGSSERVREATEDADPGVRLAAIGVLNESQARDAAADQPLAARLADDAWPDVRRAAAAALGARCQRPGPAAALESAVADPAADVAIAALGSLVSCKAPGTGSLLLATVASPERPVEVRIAAATQLGVLGDPSTSVRAVALFEANKRRAIADADAIDIAAALAVALGRLDAPTSIEPLREAAFDPAFPKIQAAAVSALSEQCPPGTAKLFASLEDSGERAVAIAAKRASLRCRGATR